MRSPTVLRLASAFVLSLLLAGTCSLVGCAADAESASYGEDTNDFDVKSGDLSTGHCLVGGNAPSVRKVNNSMVVSSVESYSCASAAAVWRETFGTNEDALARLEKVQLNREFSVKRDWACKDTGISHDGEYVCVKGTRKFTILDVR